MRWLLEFWKTDPPPAVSAIPRLVFKATLFGALIAPLLSVVFDVATTRPWFGIWEYLPQLVWYSMQMGAIFSTSFYLTCGIPPAYIRPLSRCS